jgi:hypothetical protein
MALVVPDCNDPVTPWVIKWIAFPIITVIFLWMIIGLQINQWKCSREAKRQGYLEGEFSPAYRFTPASCVCRKKVMPDGTVDDNAKMVIDLLNKELCW